MSPPGLSHPSSLIAENDGDDIAGSQNYRLPKRSARYHTCEFHPGRVVNKHFTCCQAHVSIQKGCEISPEHTAPGEYADFLKSAWTYHTTPPLSLPDPSTSRARRFRNTIGLVKHKNIKSPRLAISLDCEFGISVFNEPELTRITAVDFFSKETLVDSLVSPSVRVKNYNTRYSGVTSADMRSAMRASTCIFGRDTAREKLMQFVTPETIVVVHGGSSDLSSLRWIHPHILDTYAWETCFEPTLGGRSLKNLCEQKLNLQVQRGRGHDSLEDALACRELAILLMQQIPDN